MPLPAHTLSLVGLPPPGDSMYKEPRTAVIVRMSAETFEALENPENDRKLEVEFGDNPGFHIGGQFFPVQHTPENGNHELYLRVSRDKAGKAPLKLYANVIGKMMVERQLGEKVQVQVRGRTLEAEKARTERKAIYLEKPPEQNKPTKKTKKKEPARRAVPASSTFAIPKASPSVSSSKSTPLPASTLSSKVSPVHNSTPAASSSKTQQVAGPSKAASSPLPASTSSTASFGSEITGARARLVHCLALKPRTQEQVITMCAGKEPAPRTRNEIISILRAVAEPVAVTRSNDSDPPRWQLKLESWRDVRPFRWPNLTADERTELADRAKRAFTELGISAADPVWSHTKGPASARAPGEKNGVMSTKAKTKSAEGTRKKVSDIVIPAKDESSKGKGRDLDESSAAGTPTSATRPPGRRQPGSGYKAKHSATPPITDLRPNSPLPPAPKKPVPSETRESKRDPPAAPSRPPRAPSPAESRASTASTTAGPVRKKPKDPQTSTTARAAEDRKEERRREREQEERKRERDEERKREREQDERKREREQDERKRERELDERKRERDQEEEKPRVKVSTSPLPPSLPNFKRKKRAQDDNESEYSERDIPLSASASKKRRVEEAQPSATEKTRGRDLSLPKKPVVREPSPLGPPRATIKKEASPFSLAVSPPRASSVRSSLPPRPPPPDRIQQSSSTSASPKKGEPSRSAGKSRRKSPKYTSSESESETSVPSVRTRPVPAHSASEDPPPAKRFKATHTPRFKPRPLPKDSAGLRKYYQGCWRIYHELHQGQQQRLDRINSLLNKEPGREYVVVSDEDQDVDELSPEVLRAFMEDLNAVTSELEKVREAFDRLDGGKRDALERDLLGELVDVC